MGYVVGLPNNSYKPITNTVCKHGLSDRNHVSYWQYIMASQEPRSGTTDSNNTDPRRGTEYYTDNDEPRCRIDQTMSDNNEPRHRSDYRH